MKRYIYPFIYEDLLHKMVFIGGPRQVGKTTLAQQLRVEFQDGQYFIWDHPQDRQMIRARTWDTHAPLIIFDELHKMPHWKSWIKGIYDTKSTTQQYLITGSARLDMYKRGGDSLMGRYHYWRLHPLTLDERPPHVGLEEAFKRLLQFGGFPEPFLKADQRFAKRWRRERFDRILREDVLDLSHISSLQGLQLFVEALRTRVGALFVFSNLARDLEISPHTIKSWLKLIEAMYLVFSIYPYTQKISRAITKPPKVYFFDNADVEGGEATRLENLIATHLLKRLHFLEDYTGSRCSLHYLRDKDSREVDFVTCVDGYIQELIEVKLSDGAISTALRYYHEKLKPKRTLQLVGNLYRNYTQDHIEVMHPTQFFTHSPWENPIVLPSTSS